LTFLLLIGLNKLFVGIFPLFIAQIYPSSYKQKTPRMWGLMLIYIPSFKRMRTTVP